MTITDNVACHLFGKDTLTQRTYHVSAISVALYFLFLSVDRFLRFPRFPTFPTYWKAPFVIINDYCLYFIVLISMMSSKDLSQKLIEFFGYSRSRLDVR